MKIKEDAVAEGSCQLIQEYKTDEGRYMTERYIEERKTVTDFVKALDDADILIGVRSEWEACADNEVTSVTYNSREAGNGTLFVCKGAHFKAQYLQDAIDSGAACYVTAIEYGLGTEDCPEILVSDIRLAMPVIAETFYGKLSDELTMVGITGTKGKSTTAYYMRYILDDFMAATGGKRTAICSGIDNYDGVIEEESHLTTPEIMELFQHMNNALSTGIRYMTMEVSSQALKYDRVDGITFEAGAFLNIGSDHISAIEHPDFNDYLESKLRLFGHCRKACINLDCDEQERIKEASKACPYVITFSAKEENANVFGYDIRSKEGTVTLRVRGKDIVGCEDFDEEFTLGTFGTINVENALAAIAMSALLAVPVEFVKSGLEKAKSPGRMEVFYSEDGKRIAIVDYAHNKLSYERFFETIRDEFPDKKMIIVFGCPGGKAFARREELGTIAGKNCDYSIITEEDYGEEDVNKICLEIGEFVAAAGGKFEIITDRVEAIKKAITLMDDDTILFLPGKGRETREKRGIQYIDTPSDADVVLENM